jgi:hypothetical protein
MKNQFSKVNPTQAAGDPDPFIRNILILPDLTPASLGNWTHNIAAGIIIMVWLKEINENSKCKAEGLRLQVIGS